MRIKLSLLFFSALLSASAQVVINSNNFVVPLTPDTAKGREALGTNFVIPTPGANQQWDYSSLVPTATINYVLDSANGNAPFLTATGQISRSDVLGGLTVGGFLDYYRADQSGYFYLGTHVTANSYSISNLTGSAGDEVTVIGDDIVFNPPIKQYQFPMTMGDSWTNNFTVEVDFSLIVNALSLLDDTATLSRTYTEQYEVVGWGNIDLPLGLGNYDALLLKVYQEQVDSLFLNGAPADPFLLLGLGISQGAVTQTAAYELIVPGMKRPAVLISMDPTFTSTNWADFATDKPSGIGITEFGSLRADVFPNPTAQALSVQFVQQKGGAVYITLTDLLGKPITTVKHEGVGSVNQTVNMPEQSGVYILTITDETGKALYNQRVVKQ